MNRTDIINYLIEKNGYKRYLEIGVDEGSNFLAVNCQYKECVDPFETKNGEYTDAHEIMSNDVRAYIEKHILTHKMTSDQFFNSISSDKTYDIVFIDGLHTEEQVGRDIINSLKHLSDGGTVVVHDCLPIQYEHQTEERITPTWNGTVWKALPMLRFQGISFYTVDCDCGVGVVTFNGNADELLYSPPSNFDYNSVFSNILIRNIVLNVITPEMFLGM